MLAFIHDSRHGSLVCEEFQINAEKDFILKIYDFIKPWMKESTSNIHSELKKLLTPLTFTAVQVSHSRSYHQYTSKYNIIHES